MDSYQSCYDCSYNTEVFPVNDMQTTIHQDRFLTNGKNEARFIQALTGTCWQRAESCCCRCRYVDYSYSNWAIKEQQCCGWNPILTKLIHEKANTQTLRSSGEMILVVPKYKLQTYGLNTFNVAAPTLWNKLPSHIKILSY